MVLKMYEIVGMFCYRAHRESFRMFGLKNARRIKLFEWFPKSEGLFFVLTIVNVMKPFHILEHEPLFLENFFSVSEA